MADLELARAEGDRQTISFNRVLYDKILMMSGEWI
jgi:hypothetical protein